MTSPLKTLAIATLFSLSLAPMAQASELLSSPVDSRTLIAEIDPFDPQDVRRLDQMIISGMQAVQMAQEGLRSQNPEIRRMSQETITMMNRMIGQMMAMRLRLFPNLLNPGGGR